MTGRTAIRTPEPPDRDEHEESPPRVSRPRRTTRPPSNYARDQEIDNDQRTTRSQLRKTQYKPATQRDAVTSDDSATESEDDPPRDSIPARCHQPFHSYWLPSYSDVARTPPLSHPSNIGRSQRQIQHRPRSPTHCIAQLTPRG
jgi:hypothetical protein